MNSETNKAPEPTYLEKYNTFNVRNACDQIEACFHRGNTRQSRRLFTRLVRKHWPLSPDPQRHPKTTQFVSEYEKHLNGAQVP